MIKSGHEKLFTTNQHLSAKCSRDCSHLATEQPNTDTHMASINPRSGLHDDCFFSGSVYYWCRIIFSGFI